MSFFAAPAMTAECRWAIYENRTQLACAAIAGESKRNITMKDGTHIPRHRVWRILPHDGAPIITAAQNHAAQLNIDTLWQNAQGQPARAEAIAATVRADDDIGLLATVQTLIANPAYFHRRGEWFHPATPDALKKAKIALQRRAADNAEEQKLCDDMLAGRTPPELADNAVQLLARENKNSTVFRAAKKTAGGEQYIAELLVRLGVYADARACHEALFFHHWPPRPARVPPPLPPLPTATTTAFSIDDAGTFEIDDAFSITPDGSAWRIGLHIAVPALGVPLTDDYAAARLTSVYSPDAKYPMLSPAEIARYSLQAGAARPALSLYYRFSDDRVEALETTLELVPISDNFSLDDFAEQAPPSVQAEYEILKKFAAAPPGLSTDTRTDYRIYTDPPRVVAAPRRPVSLVVESLMRRVNTTWAKKLTGKGGLFRANGATIWRPPAEQPYAWTTSPLRRYADLANQALLIAVLDLAPSPQIQWKKLAQSLNQQQARARQMQDKMERHWILQALSALPPQTVLTAQRQPKNRVRLTDYPLAGLLVKTAARLPEAESFPVRLYDIDFFIQRARFVLA